MTSFSCLKKINNKPSSKVTKLLNQVFRNGHNPCKMLNIQSSLSPRHNPSVSTSGMHKNSER